MFIKCSVFVSASASSVQVSASTNESAGVPIYVYIIIAVVIILAIIIVAKIYMRKRKRKVASSAKEIYPKAQVLTTHQLIEEMNQRYMDADVNKRTKYKRKNPGQELHPQPNPPGPNTKIINKSDFVDHPPPMTEETDPAYPPELLGFSTENPQTGPEAPTLVEGETPPPVLNTQTKYADGTVPPPYPYKTPAEARAAGDYRV